METGRGSGSGSDAGRWVLVIAMAIVMVTVKVMGCPDGRATAPLNLPMPSFYFPRLIRTPGSEWNWIYLLAGAAGGIRNVGSSPKTERLGFLKAELDVKCCFARLEQPRPAAGGQSAPLGALPAGVQEAERANANP